MKSVETFGKTVDEALAAALSILRADSDSVDCEILEEPSKGFFGKRKDAHIRVTLKDKPAAPAEPAAEQVIEETVTETVEFSVEEPAVEIIDGEEIVYGDPDDRAAEFAASDTYGIADEDVDDGEFLEEESTACEYIISVCEAMGIDVELITEVCGSTINIEVQGDDMGAVIGRRGETIDALQYLTGLVVNRNNDKYYKICLDAENYRQKRETALIRLAKRTADKVARYKRSITLDPMNPNERRIVHSALQGYKGVTTYSVGEEPNRKVVISAGK